eukprot:CAMPEP_0181332418 /NCGR_PEP_ID=MMETSP1101-20121128/25087_1 /TAXON_ID=46948 /ORGANISM="Rhodomonas abbreviata, Strain Caron Lab Isolate" /LENGTH=65 /DNA_ID=CAMNT_0023442069 /DNA_START=158 /DNA_END=352 /DNA_ORIENTATION=+
MGLSNPDGEKELLIEPRRCVAQQRAEEGSPLPTQLSSGIVSKPVSVIETRESGRAVSLGVERAVS